jgi:hypothetical protein
MKLATFFKTKQKGLQLLLSASDIYLVHSFEILLVNLVEIQNGDETLLP